MLKTEIILKNKRKLTASVWEMDFYEEAGIKHKPGQFVNIEIEGLYLRRPISVCDENDGILRLICRSVGKGTEILTSSELGKRFDCLSFLGNGYDIGRGGKRPVLVGGGVGVPPLYMLAKRLCEKGIKPIIAVGFNNSADVFYVEEFKTLGLEVDVRTIDGSVGKQGFVTDAVKAFGSRIDYLYTCGPEPMLKAVYNLGIDGQFSFEERMGCGFGACMGCSCETLYGSKRICRDGPILMREEIKWRT